VSDEGQRRRRCQRRSWNLEVGEASEEVAADEEDDEAWRHQRWAMRRRRKRRPWRMRSGIRGGPTVEQQTRAAGGATGGMGDY